MTRKFESFIIYSWGRINKRKESILLLETFVRKVVYAQE